MGSIAPQSQRLLVLGDLFEAWIGDDCLTSKSTIENSKEQEFYASIINEFYHYSQNHGELLFLHGNRDFLLGRIFETKTGGHLCNAPIFDEVAGKKTAFIHGDELCTDDTAYQEFRKMVREPDWQQSFLAQPIQQRQAIALEMRQQSQQAQQSKSNEIMDVNQDSVLAFVCKHKLDWIIHGHTHRQASHEFFVDNRSHKRIVLGDWGEKGFYLSFDENGVSENYFSS